VTIVHRYDPNVPNALYLQNFGGAHGHSEYKDSAALVADITKILNQLKLLDRKDGYFIFGMTNSNQGHARGLLKQAGFSSRTIGNLEYHTITDKEFAKAAALAIEATKKEEERIRLEKEAAIKAMAERDEREGRKPGELRVGDVVYYHTHSVDTRKGSQYVLVFIDGKNVGYVNATSFDYYNADYLSKKGNYNQNTTLKEWERVPAEVDAQVTKKRPNILALRK
jgi:hypothetical protein